MKIKVTQSFQGSLNGYDVQGFEKGLVLDLDDATAHLFLATGCCEPDEEKKKKANDA
jgi:hypothetical protein